jgi:tetratricopeptide (TPR) repeat protein/tRNA A-37 threonylcarbamoyl transferase component Bud32
MTRTARDGGTADASTALPNSSDAVGIVIPVASDLGDLRICGADDYELGRELARGGMGRILEATDVRHGRPVAIKMLLADGPVATARFLREARITARLQHPAIVPVYEAARWATGEPFFAMKRVDGRPLDRAIAATPELADRLALLPSLIAVTDALAYAHGRGVIHRDIKPHNVLCGSFGETVVIDWGLAKELEAAEGDRDDPFEPSGASLTVAGRAMGTPSYMAPEQARGDAADQRTDVYALGALLYHVLTGEAPYRGGSTDDTLDQVRAGPPPPVATRARDAPADLCTVVDKAMARSPADRYPGAGELAVELRRFAAGQRVAAHDYSFVSLLGRFVRRHRAAVTVGALLLAALAVISVVMVRRIVVERDRAARQRAAAEDLVDFIQSDLKQRLEPIGRLDLLEGVGGRVEGYYASTGSDDPEARRRRAAALVLVGEVAELRDDPVAAARAYREALALSQRLVGERPDDASLQRQLAQTSMRLAAFLRARSDHPGAVAATTEALAAARRAVAIAPDELASQLVLADAIMAVAVDLEVGGDDDGALVRYQEGLAVARQTVARFPDSDEARHQVGIALLYVAGDQRMRGDTSDALATYRESLAIHRALADERPDDASRQFGVADVWWQIANAHVWAQQHDEALAAFAEQRAILERLLRIEPDQADWQYWLGRNHLEVGGILQARGDLDGAEAGYAASREIAERRAARVPDDASAQFEVSKVQSALADLATTRHDPVRALDWYRSALAISRQLATRAPENPRWTYAVGRGELMVCSALFELRRMPEAVAACASSIELLEPLAAASPGDRNNQMLLTEAHLGSAEVDLGAGDRTGAHAHAARALELAGRLRTIGQSDAAVEDEMEAAARAMLAK